MIKDGSYFWVISIDGTIQEDGFSSLRALAKQYELSYDSLKRSKGSLNSKGRKILIKKVLVNKIKGRAGAANFGKNTPL